ncbi:unnamed protein product [Urochloa decumbens]|uniref:F-box domain-containing protein n=1 Tax=Urochloa decumbens TaxID=240449 RepID=A0ABC8ZPX8_9POAL
MPGEGMKSTLIERDRAAASLGDDVLFEIFIRLPSLATLVRATYTCRAWRRAVASSADFRRRFRETHPAPLLGLFFDPPGADQTPALPIFPSFVPTRGADRDLAAAIRGGDFFLTSLQERPGGLHGWDIHDCRGGYILVVVHDNCRLCCSESEVALDARLLCSEEDPKLFRVIIIAHDKSRVRATVFSSDTDEWSVHQWADVPPISLPVPFKLQLLNSNNMQANGMPYWVYSNLRHMLTLDTVTMEFSVTELPLRVRASECCFVVGETNYGTPCIVYVFKFRVSLFLQTIDDDGVKRWMVIKRTSLDAQLDGLLGKLKDRYSELQIVAVRDGFAYLAASATARRYATTPSWVLSLCLEAMKLEKMFQKPYECCVHPYIMSWPLSLVGNFGSFALKYGTKST